MDALLRLVLAYARTEVAVGDGVTPFGASMAVDGELETASGADPDEVRGIFRTRAERDELVAVAVCTGVVLGEPAFTDAIRVEIEHRDDEPITFVLPYRVDEGRERPEWGELTAGPGERRTWT
ncbi:MAG TPA: hypothetical protein VK646_11725 [Actinomycetota bacterium]|nr:hypothetical protein [Actinomycetota bacterium]